MGSEMCIRDSRQGVDPEEPAPTTEQLLAEIRDLLAAENGGTTTEKPGSSF